MIFMCLNNQNYSILTTSLDFTTSALDIDFFTFGTHLRYLYFHWLDPTKICLIHGFLHWNYSRHHQNRSVFPISWWIGAADMTYHHLALMAPSASQISSYTYLLGFGILSTSYPCVFQCAPLLLFLVFLFFYSAIN